MQEQKDIVRREGKGMVGSRAPPTHTCPRSQPLDQEAAVFFTHPKADVVGVGHRCSTEDLKERRSQRKRKGPSWLGQVICREWTESDLGVCRDFLRDGRDGWPPRE